MISKSPIAQLKPSPAAPNSLIFHHNKDFCKFGYSAKNFSEHKHRFKLVGQSFGDRWKLTDINASEFFFLLYLFKFKFKFFEFLTMCTVAFHFKLQLFYEESKMKTGQVMIGGM